MEEASNFENVTHTEIERERVERRDGFHIHSRERWREVGVKLMWKATQSISSPNDLNVNTLLLSRTLWSFYKFALFTSSFSESVALHICVIIATASLLFYSIWTGQLLCAWSAQIIHIHIHTHTLKTQKTYGNASKQVTTTNACSEFIHPRWCVECRCSVLGVYRAHTTCRHTESHRRISSPPPLPLSHTHAFQLERGWEHD